MKINPFDRYSRCQFSDYILKLKPEKPSGSASLTSPAYSFTKSQVCLRITYALIFQAALKIYVKSYRKGDKMATIKEVLFTQYRGNFEGKDVLIDVSSNFQVFLLITPMVFEISTSF